MMEPASVAIGLFSVVVNLNTLAWAVFLAITFLLFGYDDWKTLLLLNLPFRHGSHSPGLNVARSAGRPFVLVSLDPSNDLRQSVPGRYAAATVWPWSSLVSAFRPEPRLTIHRQYERYTREKFALAAAKKSAEDPNKAKGRISGPYEPRAEDAMNAIIPDDAPGVERPPAPISGVPGGGISSARNFTGNC